MSNFWKTFQYTAISIGAIWSLLLAVWAVNEYKLSSRRKNPSHNVVAIAQVCTEGERLQTVHLAGLLGLSQDAPSNLFSLDFRALEKKLFSCPVIKSASVRPLVPSLVHIEYATRIPVASVADYADTAVDNEGVLFPLYPFFSAKRLPQLHLGSVQDITWGKLSLPELALGLEILEYCKKDNLTSIDTRNAYASGGRREIVLNVEGKLIRINTASWREEIALFFKALPVIEKQTGMKKSTIVDMRNAGIILIKQEVV